MQLFDSEIETYLSRSLGVPVRVMRITDLAGSANRQDAMKGFGYGSPLCVEYIVRGASERVIVRQVKRNGFGHERVADRVAEVWEDFTAFNRLPSHVRAKDIITIEKSGRLNSIADAEELLLVTEYVPGELYAADLKRIQDNSTCTEQDLFRARSLAKYLGGIHSVKCNDPLLWNRRLRDLIGDGEGIFGQTDGYPDEFCEATAEDLRLLEEQANRWRWKLKPLKHRLSQVHGDFHPFNILFEEDSTPHMLDRSRGEYGEPADDVSAMTINYIFFALQHCGTFAAPFETLYKAFFETYLTHTHDDELLHVIQPWYAWRSLVVASPVWYPSLDPSIRRKMLNFARRVLEEERFEWQNANQYLM